MNTEYLSNSMKRQIMDRITTSGAGAAIILFYFTINQILPFHLIQSKNLPAKISSLVRTLTIVN